MMQTKNTGICCRGEEIRETNKEEDQVPNQCFKLISDSIPGRSEGLPAKSACFAEFALQGFPPRCGSSPFPSLRYPCPTEAITGGLSLSGFTKDEDGKMGLDKEALVKFQFQHLLVLVMLGKGPGACGQVNLPPARGFP